MTTTTDFDFWTIRYDERIEHNHIFQWDAGAPECPACAVIDPQHMTERYVEEYGNLAPRQPLDIPADWH